MLADATEAEELLTGRPYDAVLLDLNLPNGGAGFLRRMIGKRPGLAKKLIILTSLADDARLLADVPRAALLRKPVEIYELIETVHKCVLGERE